MKISVIITTYNRPDALQLILQSLNDQNDKNFEVVIGDDGSREDTALMIRNMQKICNYKIIHAFQEDRGFRLSRARNLAASLATGEYLIFLDGDCIPRTSFVRAHRMLARRDCIVAGNRILLSEKFTKQVLKYGIKVWLYSYKDWFKAYLKHYIKRLHPFITFPYFHRIRLFNNSWKKVRGCNFALFKDEFIRVNGCDSDFEGWGYEDSDLAVRLIHAGIKIKSGRYATAVLHLWHKENDRTKQEHNLKKLKDRINSRIIKAENGIQELKDEE